MRNVRGDFGEEDGKEKRTFADDDSELAKTLLARILQEEEGRESANERQSCGTAI